MNNQRKAPSPTTQKRLNTAIVKFNFLPLLGGCAYTPIVMRNARSINMILSLVFLLSLLSLTSCASETTIFTSYQMPRYRSHVPNSPSLAIVLPQQDVVDVGYLEHLDSTLGVGSRDSLYLNFLETYLPTALNSIATFSHVECVKYELLPNRHREGFTGNVIVDIPKHRQPVDISGFQPNLVIFLGRIELLNTLLENTSDRPVTVGIPLGSNVGVGLTITPNSPGYDPRVKWRDKPIFQTVEFVIWDNISCEVAVVGKVRAQSFVDSTRGSSGLVPLAQELITASRILRRKRP